MLLMMLEMEEEEEEERRKKGLDRGKRKGRGMQNREAEKERGKEAKSGIKKGKKKYAEEFLGQKSPPVGVESEKVVQPAGILGIQ